MSNIDIALCAEVAADIAVEAQQSLYSADHYRQTFLSRLQQRASAPTVAATDAETVATEDDEVEALVRRIVESDRLARSETADALRRDD